MAPLVIFKIKLNIIYKNVWKKKNQQKTIYSTYSEYAHRKITNIFNLIQF